jgi:predicted glycosyltransferase
MLRDSGSSATPPLLGRGARVLIYSHDTFGLGHLRRCRTIAHSLVENHPDLSVLILSGSPIIGSFDFRRRVDFVRVPGVIKLRNGEYTSLNLHLQLEETLSMRSSIIEHTAAIFDPDVFIVDKEPLGLRGEIQGTLEMLKKRGTRLVLGLRDVLDEPALLVPEWERKNALPALRDFYDEIWVYGLPQICEPLSGLPLPRDVTRKLTYTGYLPITVAEPPAAATRPEITNRPYLLVTTGGGGDGESLIDWTLRTYESDEIVPYPALLVLGPFMQPEKQAEFLERAERLSRVQAIVFNPRIENLEENAVGILAMGGYNTFCEILSLDKRAIIVPRTLPRREQYIRASRAQDLGLVRMLEDDGRCDPAEMAAALRSLPRQARPSEVVVPGLLEGLINVNRLIDPWLGARTALGQDAQNVAAFRPA